MSERAKAPGTVTLMGSGEMTDSMSKVHRLIAANIHGPIRAVFIDTPAGFELNADNLSNRAVDYIRHHLGVTCEVATFKSASKATEREVQSAVRKLERANYIFAGPGSPSYAIRNWRDTPVWETLVRRIDEGAHLVLASAAAIALGRCSLPVYEIYKVGEGPHWIEGLGLFAPYGLDVTIVTHWNNSEGGTYDTRFCYMGEARFRPLEKKLAPTTVVLGVDEYTACIIDVAKNEARVMASGTVTVRHDGQEKVFESGSTFSLDELRTAPAPQEAERPLTLPREAATAAAGRDLMRRLEEAETVLQADEAGMASAAGVADAVYELARAIDAADEEDVPFDLSERARRGLGRIVTHWSRHLAAPSESVAGVAPFVELLIDVRARLRAAREFALADEVRQRLLDAGIVLEDMPEGTTWRQAEQEPKRASSG